MEQRQMKKYIDDAAAGVLMLSKLCILVFLVASNIDLNSQVY